MTDLEHSPKPVAVAQHVSHAYGGGEIPVLEDVSLELAAGDVTAVVGPNGSGKSTLLGILAGVETPSGGTVERSRSFDRSGESSRGVPATDEDSTDDAPNVHGRGDRRAVGWLPQRLAPRGSFTVRETLAFYDGLVDRGPTPDEALSRVGMTAVADRRVDALSGGMRRLLGVALASIGDPPLLVLDEPTSGLDPTMTMRIFDALADLASDGRAVVCSSHDLAAVERTADTVVLLDRGEIQSRGPPADVAAGVGADSLVDAFDGAFETEAETTVRHRARP